MHYKFIFWFDFVLGENGVQNPPNTKTSPSHILNDIQNTKKLPLLKKCSGDSYSLDSIEREDFLTLFDSCNAFVFEMILRGNGCI